MHETKSKQMSDGQSSKQKKLVHRRTSKQLPRWTMQEGRSASSACMHIILKYMHTMIHTNLSSAAAPQASAVLAVQVLCMSEWEGACARACVCVSVRARAGARAGGEGWCVCVCVNENK